MSFLKNIFGLSVLSAVLFGVIPSPVLAVGISPVLFEANGLLQNSSISRQVYVTRSNPAEDEQGIARVTGAGAPYIRLPNDGRFAMPKGLYNTPYEFFIEPGNLEEGTYEARIQVAPTALSGDATGAAGSQILTGALATIRFTVTTEEREVFAISNPQVREAEEGQILSFLYHFNNTGNVDTRLNRIDVSIRDEQDPSFLYTEEIAQEKLKIFKALSTNSDTVPTKANLPIGSYVMKIVFYKNDTAVFTSRDLRFRVSPRGTLSQKGETVSFEVDKAEYENGEIVGFKGVFENTGNVGYMASMGVSVYQDEKRIDSLSTESKFVPSGEKVTFEKDYRPELSGSYRALGSFSFGARKTEESGVDFSIKNRIPFWAILLVLILIVVALYLISRRIFKKRPDALTAIQMPMAKSPEIMSVKPVVKPTVPPTVVPPTARSVSKPPAPPENKV